MQDPEVQALLPKLMSGDPSAMAAVQNNPKLAKLVGKVGGMVGGGGAGGPWLMPRGGGALSGWKSKLSFVARKGWAGTKDATLSVEW